MTPRHALYAAGATLAAVLIWYFWDDLRVIYQGGETETDDAEADLGVEVTGSESKRMLALLPQVQAALQSTINDLAGQGIRTFIGQTTRTAEQEAANKAKGASATLRSWHLLRRAVDMYIIDPATGDPDLAGRNFELYKVMHQTAAKYGFTNISFYADWSKRLITTSKGKIWDGGHMQFTEGKTWAEASLEEIS